MQPNKLIKIKPINHSQSSSNVEFKDKVKNLQNQIQEETTQLAKLKNQKEQLLAETKQAIEEEKEQWKAEKELLEREIRKKGYEEGFTLGEEAGFAEYKDALQKVNEISEQAIQDYHSTLENSTSEILQIAVHVAEKIMKKELEENVALCQSFIKEAIKNLENKEKLTIYVSTKFYGHLIEQKQEFLQILENETTLLIKLKEDLPPFGCLLEHSTGMIDIGIDSQLNEIREVVEDFVMESKR